MLSLELEIWRRPAVYSIECVASARISTEDTSKKYVRVPTLRRILTSQLLSLVLTVFLKRK